MADPQAWTLRLSPEDQAELDAALATAKAKSADPLELGHDDFPLDGLAAKLEGVVDVLLNGRGFARIATLDTERYGDEISPSSTGASGCISASPGPRTSTATCWATSRTRARRSTIRPCGATSSAASPSTTTRTVRTWWVCSACARPARGGLSCVANAVAIHNQLVREHPDLAAALYEPMPYDARGEQAKGAAAFYAIPGFTEHAGRLFVRFIPQYILASQRHPDAPRLSPAAREAIAAVVGDGQRPGLQRVHGPAAR